MRISDWSSDVCSSDLKGACALNLLEEHRRDDLIVEEGGAAVGDLVLQRDPQMPGDRLGRCDMAPVREHRFLHPAQIMGVVDVSHEVDDVGTDLDVVIVGQCGRSEEHTSALQSLMRISYAVFCLTKKKYIKQKIRHNIETN